MQGFMPEDHWSGNECPVRFSERPIGGVWRKRNVKFFCTVRSSAGQWVLLLLRKTKDFVFLSRRRTDEINESLNGPVQANRSDGTKPGIGIERKNKPTINMKKRSIGKRGNYKLLSVHFIKLAGTSVNSSCRISFASIFPSGPTKIMWGIPLMQ